MADDSLPGDTDDRTDHCEGGPLNNEWIIEMALILAIAFFMVRLVVGFNKKRVKYVDTGHTGSFRSAKFKIIAKPDLIENRRTIIEKKSRRVGVYESDRKQLIATALAVRSTYPIREGYVQTQTQRELVDLSGSDKALFRLIEKEYEYAQLVASGITPPPSPARSKCNGCQFRDRCEFSAA